MRAALALLLVALWGLLADPVTANAKEPGDGPVRYWQEPAVSPDGKWVAFTRVERGPKGLVWRRSVGVATLDGSRVIQLTHGPGHSWAPRWAGGGRELLFLSDRSGVPQLYRLPMTQSGEALALTRFSAGVDRYVVSSGGDAVVVLAPVGAGPGGGKRESVRTSTGCAWGPVWVGEPVLHVYRLEGNKAGHWSTPKDLTPERVCNVAKPGGDGEMDLHPGGHVLALALPGGGLELLDAKGRRPQLPPVTGRALGPRWSRDGRWLAWIEVGKGGSEALVAWSVGKSEAIRTWVEGHAEEVGWRGEQVWARVGGGSGVLTWSPGGRPKPVPAPRLEAGTTTEVEVVPGLDEFVLERWPLVGPAGLMRLDIARGTTRRLVPTAVSAAGATGGPEVTSVVVPGLWVQRIRAHAEGSGPVQTVVVFAQTAALLASPVVASLPARLLAEGFDVLVVVPTVTSSDAPDWVGLFQECTRLTPQRPASPVALVVAFEGEGIREQEGLRVLFPAGVMAARVCSGSGGSDASSASSASSGSSAPDAPDAPAGQVAAGSWGSATVQAFMGCGVGGVAPNAGRRFLAYTGSGRVPLTPAEADHWASTVIGELTRASSRDR